MNKIAAIDIGNTRIKVLTAKNEFISFSYRDMSNSEIIEILSFLKEYNEIRISSVNEIIKEVIVKNFEENKLHFADSLLNRQSIINYDKIKGIGTDRLCGLIGARTLSNGNLITIDCGTANTINFLDENNNVLGGYILPGFRTQLDAINSKTNKIFIDPYKLKNFKYIQSIPNNTEDAVISGILKSTSNGINSIISNHFHEFKPNRVIITGGYREHLLDQLINSKNINLKDDKYYFQIQNTEIELIIEPKLILIGLLSI